jgi:hypothetical protein
MAPRGGCKMHRVFNIAAILLFFPLIFVSCATDGTQVSAYDSRSSVFESALVCGTIEVMLDGKILDCSGDDSRLAIHFIGENNRYTYYAGDGQDSGFFCFALPPGGYVLEKITGAEIGSTPNIFSTAKLDYKFEIFRGKARYLGKIFVEGRSTQTVLGVSVSNQWAAFYKKFQEHYPTLTASWAGGSLETGF